MQRKRSANHLLFFEKHLKGPPFAAPMIHLLKNKISLAPENLLQGESKLLEARYHAENYPRALALRQCGPADRYISICLTGSERDKRSSPADKRSTPQSGSVDKQ